MDISQEAREAGKQAAMTFGGVNDLEDQVVEDLALFMAQAMQQCINAQKDTARLNFLQELTNKKLHTGKVVMRMSNDRRGWRLHETEALGAVEDVRTAIDNFVELQPRIHIVEGGLDE